MPASADDPRCSPDCCATSWGFTGTVVADYFGVGFLETLHGWPRTAATPRAWRWPRASTWSCPPCAATATPLVAAVRDGPRAGGRWWTGRLRRVLLQKCELGLLDPDRKVLPAVLNGVDPGQARGTVDLDPPRNRAAGPAARRASRCPAGQPRGRAPAERHRTGSRSSARAPTTRWPCSAATPSPATSACSTPRQPMGIDVPTVLEALRAELPGAEHRRTRRAATWTARTPPRIAEAAALAAGADVCVAVLGDRAGPVRPRHLRRGLRRGRPARCPVVQGELLDALLATGTPVVLVLLTGRPYALGRLCGPAGRLCAGVLPRRGGRPGARGRALGAGQPLRAAAR